MNKYYATAVKGANMQDNPLLIDALQRLAAAIEGITPDTPLGDINAAQFVHHCAFKWFRDAKGKGKLWAIQHPALMEAEHLLGIERQKHEVMQNTAQFIAKLPANHVLLWGTKGTGKSSLIRAVLNQYQDQGLRLIEMDRADLADMPIVAEILQSLPYRFIIYCDDLSFEQHDSSYKALKAILDGSFMAPAENILVYATSNRRHLLPEYMQDNFSNHVDANGELHQGEAVEEKISLSERFGLWVSFYPFDQATYLRIVSHWLNHLMQQKIEWQEDIEREALRFALYRGSRSGRIAYQFAKQWVGKQCLESLKG